MTNNSKHKIITSKGDGNNFIYGFSLYQLEKQTKSTQAST